MLVLYLWKIRLWRGRRRRREAISGGGWWYKWVQNGSKNKKQISNDY